MSSASTFNKADTRGVPSLVWRAGQERRLKLILATGGPCLPGRILVDGCGIGAYVERLVGCAPASPVVGLDIEVERVQEAHQRLDGAQETAAFLGGAGETLPFPDGAFHLVLSHEVLEHVQDDQAAIREIVRVL